MGVIGKIVALVYIILGLYLLNIRFEILSLSFLDSIKGWFFLIAGLIFIIHGFVFLMKKKSDSLGPLV